MANVNYEVGNYLMQGSRGLAQGMQDYAAGIAESKEARAQAKSTADYIDANAALFGLKQDQVDAMTAQSPDESPRAYNARLNSLIGNFMVGQKAKESQMAIQAQQLQNAILMKRMYAGNDWMNGSSSQAPNSPGGGSPSIPPYLQPNASSPSQQPSPQSLQQYLPVPTPGTSIQTGSVIHSGPLAHAQDPIIGENPPAPVTMDDPRVKAQYKAAFGASFGNPEAAMKAIEPYMKRLDDQNKAVYDAKAAKKDVVGVVPAGAEYTGGVPVNDLFHIVHKVGRGTASERLEESDQTIKFAPGQVPSTLPFWTRTDKGLIPAGSAPADPGINPNDPEWQKQVGQAFEQVAQSGVSLSRAQLLNRAIQAYNADPLSGSKLNLLLGSKAGASLRQLISDPRNPNTLNTLKMAISTNLKTVIDQLKSQQGNLGFRLTENELNALYDMIGNPSIDPQTLALAGGNMEKFAQWSHNLNTQFAHYRKTKQPGDAEELALKDVGEKPILDMPADPASRIPPRAISALKSNPKLSADFDAKYGKGMSKSILAQ